jgi:hypothetical protein
MSTINAVSSLSSLAAYSPSVGPATLSSSVDTNDQLLQALQQVFQQQQSASGAQDADSGSGFDSINNDDDDDDDDATSTV